MKNINPKKTHEQLRSFIGMINYYRGMWRILSDIIAPLSELTSNKLKFKWNDEHQKIFYTVKKVIGHEYLWTYPDLNILFKMNMDVSSTCLGAVILQRGKPINFYSRKLNPTQRNYTMTERELLSILETLKESRNALLWHKIIVHTDHKNLTYKNSNTEHVMWWCLVIKEFGPELKYVKVKNNVVSNVFSRIEFSPNTTKLNIFKCFGYDGKDILPQSYPIQYYYISREKNKEKYILSELNSHKYYEFITFCGGDKTHELVWHKGKTVLPRPLQNNTVEWYHDTLYRTGETWA